MPRLSDAQVRNARVQALRAVRRSQRKLDTRVEVMERRLDRAIENKERVTFVLLDSVISDFSKFVTIVREIESQITDASIIFTQTS